MDITAFVRELMFSHDCVIVPGFGGFIGNYAPAHTDKASGTFYPPVKQISFNRNLNHNDGLLVGKITSSLGISYGDARSLVEKYVADVKSRLERGGSVVFDHLGTFTRNQEGNLQFEPDRTVNYHLDSYGLEPFQCFPLEGYDVRKRVIRRAGKDAVKSLSVRKILWRAAVILPLMAVIITVPLKTDLFRPKMEATTLNPLVSAEFEHNKVAVDKAAEKTTVVAFAEDKKEESADITKVTAETVSTDTDGIYQLITGSFRSEENARKQAAILAGDGFKAEIISAANGFFRVSAVSCKDLASAEKQKRDIISRFPETWIVRKK